MSLGFRFVLGAIAALLAIRMAFMLMFIVYRAFFETRGQRLARLVREYGEAVGRANRRD